MINFDSNQLWHKSLKQNQPRKISTIQAIWRTIRRYFESDSRQFESNSRVIRDLSAAGVTIGAMAYAIAKFRETDEKIARRSDAIRLITK